MEKLRKQNSIRGRETATRNAQHATRKPNAKNSLAKSRQLHLARNKNSGNTYATKTKNTYSSNTRHTHTA